MNWNFTAIKPERVTKKVIVDLVCDLSRITHEDFSLEEYSDGAVALRKGNMGRRLTDYTSKSNMWYFLVGMIEGLNGQ